MGGAQEILVCDPSIFTVPTTTTVEDRKSLLRLQNVARTRGPYHYLEVGSHLGGSLVPHLIDPLCAGIVSIDTRPSANPDIRGRMSLYPNNSTERMLAILRKEVGEAVSKIKTFDTEAAGAVQSVKTKVDLAFIDGEHTNRATFADFIAVREMTKPDAIIGFHNSHLITDAIINGETLLRHLGVRHSTFFLPDSVCAVATGNMIEAAEAALRPFAYERNKFLAAAEEILHHKISRQRSRINRTLKAVGLLEPARRVRQSLKRVSQVIAGA